jgi:hypothetical protein
MSRHVVSPRRFGGIGRVLGLALCGALGTASRAGAAPPEAETRLWVEALRSPEASKRAGAASWLSRAAPLPKEAIDALRTAREDPQGSVQKAVLDAFAALLREHRELAPDLVKALSSREHGHRSAAANGLSTLDAAALAPHADAIAERLDPRDTDIVEKCARPLLRGEKPSPKAVEAVFRAWKLSRHLSLGQALVEAGAVSTPLLVDALDDPDERGHDTVLALLGRLSDEMLASQSERLVAILLRDLPRTQPRTAGNPTHFGLLLRVAPAAPEAEERIVDAAAAWLAAASRQGGPQAGAELLAVVQVHPSRPGVATVALRVARRWKAAVPDLSVLPKGYLESAIANALPAISGSKEEIAALIAEAAGDERLLRTIAANVAGKPAGDEALHALFASKDVVHRRIALQAYSDRPRSPDVRDDILGLLEDPDGVLAHEALRVLLGDYPYGRDPRSTDLFRGMSGPEKVRVLGLMRRWIEGADVRLRLQALIYVRTFGTDAAVLGPVIAERLRAADLRGGEWWALAECLTSTRGWEPVRPLMRSYLTSPDAWVRAAGVVGLASAGGEDPGPLVALAKAMLESRDADVQAAGIGCVSSLGKAAAPLEPWFVARMSHPDPSTAMQAYYVVGSIGSLSEGALAAFRVALRQPDRSASAAHCLMPFGARAVPVLVEAVRLPDVRSHVVGVLDQMSDATPEALAALESLAKDADADVANQASNALRYRARRQPK